MRVWLGILLVALGCSEAADHPLEPSLTHINTTATVTIVPDTLRLELAQAGDLRCDTRKGNGALSNRNCRWRALDAGIITLAADSDYVRTLRVTAVASGTARVWAQNGGHRDTAVVVVAGSPPPPPPPPPPGGDQAARSDSFYHSIGVNVHLGYTDRNYYQAWTTITRPRLVELGAAHLRDHAANPTIWWHDQIRDRALDLATVGYTFSWVSDPRFYNTPQQTVDWAKGALAATGQVEGPNEWDLSQPDDCGWAPAHIAYLTDLAQRWRGDAALAGRPVAGPSHFEAWGTTPGCLGNIGSLLDYGNIHPYPFPDPPEISDDLDAQLTGFATTYGGKPWMNTETGYHTGGAGSDRPVTEAQHARWMPRLLLWHFQRGLVRSYVYELLDQCTDMGNRECNFGLVRLDGTPKPGFHAVRRLLALTKDPTAHAPGQLAYTLGGDLTNVRRLLLQRSDGRFLLVVWIGGQDAADRGLPLTFPAPIQGLRIFEPNTQDGPVWTEGAITGMSLTVKSIVRVVEITP